MRQIDRILRRPALPQPKRQASLDLDFLLGKYTVNKLSKSFGDIITFSRASAATRVNALGQTETVAANVPRIDYDPVTLACLGLLIEEQRTNTLRYSQCDTLFSAHGTTPPGAGSQVTHLGKSCTSMHVTPLNTDVGYGGCRVDRANTDGYCDISAGVPYVGTINLSLSRPLTGAEQVVFYWTGMYGSPWFVIDVNNSSQFVDKFSRISIFDTPAATGSNYPVIFLGSPVSSDLVVYITEGQAETGFFATSYIPTTSAQVTRAEDVCSINTLSPWINQSEGTLLTEVTYDSAAVATFTAASLNFGSVDNYMMLFKYDIYSGSLGKSNGVTQFEMYAGSAALGAICKQALGYKANDFAYVRDGLSVNSDTTGSVPNVSTLTIGARSIGDASINGHIRKLRYIQKRLTDAQLQALTA